MKHFHFRGQINSLSSCRFVMDNVKNIWYRTIDEIENYMRPHVIIIYLNNYIIET